MNLDIVESVDGVPIRLTDTQWEHILEEHPYMNGYYQAMLDCINYPEFVLRGRKGSKGAVLNVGRKKWLHVFYRQLNKTGGFIITAYIKNDYDEDLIIWRRD